MLLPRCVLACCQELSEKGKSRSVYRKSLEEQKGDTLARMMYSGSAARIERTASRLDSLRT